MLTTFFFFSFILQLNTISMFTKLQADIYKFSGQCRVQ